jgi:hypothetical protein
LSRLAVVWIKLGIRPERIVAGKPRQNGCHERLHRTLKEATAMPPADRLTGQQTRFDAFRCRGNLDRKPYCLTGECSPVVERCLTARVPVASLISWPGRSSPSQF